MARLQDSPVTSDSLLLVTGTKHGEMAVIERSPNRAAVREADGGFIVVTNDYRSLPTSRGAGAVAALADTSCVRFDRATVLISQQRPSVPEDCFAVLYDEKVRMNITVQSMVLSAQRGIVDVRVPG